MINYSSKQARQQWREVLDTILRREGDILIERNGKEIAVILPAADYALIQESLEELRDAREADALYNAWKLGELETQPIEAVMRDLGIHSDDDASADALSG